MNRRGFLKNSIRASSALLIAPSIMSGCGSDEDLTPLNSDKKIIVIGAGISGLATANYFSSRNVRVTVLEAQNKIGGRIKTEYFADHPPFDLGASWIHGPSRDNPITDLAKQAGANTVITDDENLIIYNEHGVPYADSITDEAYTEFEKIVRELSLSGNRNQSFAEAFFTAYPDRRNDPLWNYQLSAYLEFSTGSDITQLSARYFNDDEEFAGKDVIVTNGYDTIATHLAQNLEIHLNNPVLAIDYTEQQIKITTVSQDYEADYVVVTIPLGVLQKGSVEFTPVLPKSKLDALGGLSMNAMNKFLCIWNSPFWDMDAQYIGYTPSRKGKFNYFLNFARFASSSALMTFGFGDYGLETETMSDVQVADAITQHLRTIYGENAVAPKEILRTKWMSNPYARGSYSFVSKGGSSKDYDTLAESLENRIYFAGEHTHKDYRGTVHGAYLSGLREAKKIAALL